MLHKALADAVRLGLLDHNVVAAVSPPRVSRPQLSVWTVDQLRDFLTRASSHRLSANPASFSSTFDRLVTRSGLPRIRRHDLRHTYATLALRLGTHPVLLSERLGHTSIEVTTDGYSRRPER